MSRVLLPREFDANDDSKRHWADLSIHLLDIIFSNLYGRERGDGIKTPWSDLPIDRLVHLLDIILSNIYGYERDSNEGPLPAGNALDKRPWADLPVDVLHIILSNLYGRDSVRFRLTCRRWQSLPLPIRSSLPPVQYVDWVREFPWLVSLNNHGVLNLFHPITNEKFVMNMAELDGSHIYCSNFGWLLMSQAEGCMFFFNPFTMEIIRLLQHEYVRSFFSAVFTAPPTSPDCMIFGHCISSSEYVYIFTCRRRHGKEDNMSWRDRLIPAGMTFVPSPGNTILREGKFYHMDAYGRFGIFDPERDEDEDEDDNQNEEENEDENENEEENEEHVDEDDIQDEGEDEDDNENEDDNVNEDEGEDDNENENEDDNVNEEEDDSAAEEETGWKVVPQKIGPTEKITKSSRFRKNYYKSYIAECEGDLIALFMGENGYPLRLFKEESSDRWVELKSLGNRMMFVSESTSILLPAKVKGTENKIYFPRFQNQGKVSVPGKSRKVRSPENESRLGVFYCLQTHKYRSFGSTWSGKDLDNTVVGSYYSWIQPSM